ncbi:MAG: P-loop NTPase [Promethearchaeota archaeon]
MASGKGGTGKTTIVVNLALSLDCMVQILDCDVDEPNVHTLLPLQAPTTEPVYTMVPSFNESLCTQSMKCVAFCPNHAIFVSKAGIKFFENLCYGCGGCILVCPSKAIAEDKRQLGVTHYGRATKNIELIYGELDIGEPLVVPVIKAVKSQAKRDKESTIIIDCPPGVSCPMVESVYGSDFCLLVTEPTPFGLHDLQLAVDTVRRLDIPFGVIINRAGIGDQQVYTYCRKEEIPILLEIPHSREIAELFSEGVPFVTRKTESKNLFKELYKEIQRRVEQ